MPLLQKPTAAYSPRLIKLYRFVSKFIQMFIISGLFYKQKIFLFAPDSVLWKKKFYLAQAAAPADVYRAKGSAWLRPLGVDTLSSSRLCPLSQVPSDRFFSFIFFGGLSVFGGAARRASTRGKFLVRCSAMLKTYFS
jgi:hypothetical protein